ncbi:hypothetical protein MIMGU_mgv1a025001mg [Erythranthe guttata]|uniref:KIB1-4 beta-propeller domain-containing protein n=1 Tax=Erythranthe guttata TaxID=4155 RepID=A0A022PPX1_ERYGU|nr:hypothetical protein MIMGU_mgv1a025001mg [Erythranthe guttata]
MGNEAPTLFILHGDFKEKQLIYNLFENDVRVLNLPILQGMRILSSSYGWLGLSNPMTNECCLLNPTSMEIVNLPYLPISCVYTKCILSKPPTDPDCHILFNSANSLEQSFCRIGDEEFCHVKEIDEDGENFRLLRAVGSFNGTIYGIIDPDDVMVTIHFVGKTLEFRPIMMVDGEVDGDGDGDEDEDEVDDDKDEVDVDEDGADENDDDEDDDEDDAVEDDEVDDEDDERWCIPELSCQVSRPYEYMWLIESPQSACSGEVELLLVKKTYLCNYIDDGLDFKVFKIDTDEMTCVELDDIGQRAIFVSHHGSGFCCSSSTKIKSNSIYYTDRYGRYLYIYELEDSTTTSLLPSDLADCDSVISWVEPEVVFSQIIQEL